MRKYSLWHLMICLAWVFSSCLKPELPVPAHNPGNVITAAVNMESDYRYQFYYDLETNTVVGQNLKTAWDLGFETSADGFHVVLNTSKAMFVIKATDTNFAAISDTNGFMLNRRWDETSGNLDSTAIGDWRNQNSVYIIDRGYNEKGKPQGFWKIRFLSVNNQKFTVRFANLDGSNEKIFDIPKDSTYNLSFLSFENCGEVVTIEPPKTSWDLAFTQYTYIFYDETPVLPYTVTGCLLNRHNTTAKMDSTIPFDAIHYDFASLQVLSSDISAIGYGWKTFSGQNYTVYPEMNYIIKTSEGFYFKLHFIDFYNEQGQKGSPKWEFQRL